MVQPNNKLIQQQADLAERCRRVINLYIAYYNSGECADVFGREFYHAVGDILNGTSLKNLEVFHINPKSIPDVIVHQAPLVLKKRKEGPKCQKQKKE
jgi:hypothetical protein